MSLDWLEIELLILMVLIPIIGAMLAWMFKIQSKVSEHDATLSSVSKTVEDNSKKLDDISKCVHKIQGSFDVVFKDAKITFTE